MEGSDCDTDGGLDSNGYLSIYHINNLLCVTLVTREYRVPHLPSTVSLMVNFTARFGR